MIVVNENGKTLVVVGSWEEMYERIGFQQTVNPDAVKMKNVIGWYSLPTLGPCALTSCRTKHLRGYIVDLGEGLETNIGNICGFKHFGLVFKRAKDAFHTELNAQRFREQITGKRHEVPSFLARLERLRDGDFQADDCYRRMNRQMSQLFDEPTSRALKRKAGRGDNRIIRSVALTADEKELALGFGGEQDYREEVVGFVNGIQAANTYARLSSRRLDTLRSEIEEFATLDADSLTHKQLRQYGGWANRLDKVFRDLEETLANCQRFLVPENIAQINSQKFNLHKS